jgi:hypothetical protein
MKKTYEQKMNDYGKLIMMCGTILLFCSGFAFMQGFHNIDLSFNGCIFLEGDIYNNGDNMIHGNYHSYQDLYGMGFEQMLSGLIWGILGAFFIGGGLNYGKEKTNTARHS